GFVLSLIISASFLYSARLPPALPSFPTRRSSDLLIILCLFCNSVRLRYMRLTLSSNILRSVIMPINYCQIRRKSAPSFVNWLGRSEEHTSELQSRFDLVCRLLLEKKKYYTTIAH